jgi:hypothetical protein
MSSPSPVQWNLTEYGGFWWSLWNPTKFSVKTVNKKPVLDGWIGNKLENPLMQRHVDRRLEWDGVRNGSRNRVSSNNCMLR